jgi:hypothetical protein
VLAVAATGSLAIAIGGADAAVKSPGYTPCSSQIDSYQFWRYLQVQHTTCVTAARVGRAWVRRFARHDPPQFPKGRHTVRGYSCRLQFPSYTENPYGRVTCSRGAARIRFYGIS